MKKKITFLLMLFSTFTLQAQIPDLAWANSVNRTSYTYGYDNSLVVDAAGNVYRTGHFIDTTDFDPGPGVFNLISAGSKDVFVLKLSSSGAFIWAKRVGDSLSDHGTAIAVDGAGNVYVTGGFYGTADFNPGPSIYNLTSAGNGDIFVLKLDSYGNFVWAEDIGGAGSDMANSIAIDGAGSLYFTGVYRMTVDFDPGPGVYNLTGVMYNDAFVCKLNSAGGFAWAKGLGGPESEVGFFVTVNSVGEVYTIGSFLGTVDFDPGFASYNMTSISTDWDDDIFISKLDVSGNFLWAKQIGGGDYQYGYSIAVDAEGNLYSTGKFIGTMDFDPGSSIYNLITTSTNAFILKLDGSGNFMWAKVMESSGGVVSHSITTDAESNVYTTGFFNDTTDFDPGVGIFNLNPSDYNDVFISKLDSSGNFVWALQVGQDGNAFGNAIALHGNSIYLTGGFNDTTDFDPGAGTFNLISDYYNGDMFFMKLKNKTATIYANQNASALNELSVPENKPVDTDTNLAVIPNVFTPNNDGVNDIFIVPGINSGSEAIIYDRWGVEIRTCNASIGWDGRSSSGSECAVGVYYYLVTVSNDQTLTGFVQLLR